MSEILNSKNIQTIEFDALIIGGGGSGMRTSLELAKSGLTTAVFKPDFASSNDVRIPEPPPPIIKASNSIICIFFELSISDIL